MCTLRHAAVEPGGGHAGLGRGDDPDDDTPPQQQQQSASLYASLIAKVQGWRNDPCYVSEKAHTDRWDRVLLALGETVSDASLTAMTAAEAQVFADRGWTRWTEVAAALTQIEGGGTQAPAVPGIVTKRSHATEGRQDAVVFDVRLSRAATGTVRVDYVTADGAGRWAGMPAAAAGADYTATSGTLTFAAGETAKTVSVPILDDAIDEGSEFFLLCFSNPQGATLDAGHREWQGLILNSDPLQLMWLSRFGRMVASDAVETLTALLETPRNAGSHVTLAGHVVTRLYFVA